MSGHNKWSKVKHIKGPADAKRGKLFTKIIREISVAARLGGGDIAHNPRLRAAVQTAKDNSMPKDNIERAIKKGTGELEGETLEEATYEGYGPAGVALLIETTSDNKNRTVADLRNILKNNHGHMAEHGSVAWMFAQFGQLLFAKEKHQVDTIMEIALEAGAQDVNDSPEAIEVLTSVNDIYKVKEVFDRLGIHPVSTGFTFTPKTTVPLEQKDVAQKVLHLLEAIEDHDDVQRVHANYDLDEKLYSELSHP